MQNNANQDRIILRYSKERYMANSEDLKKNYAIWRSKMHLENTGFFAVFNNFDKYFTELSPGAITLYLYLGIHSNNRYGVVFHSIDTMAGNLNKSPRTISNWLQELEEAQLIHRQQEKFNGVSITYLMPY